MTSKQGSKRAKASGAEKRGWGSGRQNGRGYGVSHFRDHGVKPHPLIERNSRENLRKRLLFLMRKTSCKNTQKILLQLISSRFTPTTPHMQKVFSRDLH